jgi:hypothetical protein
LAHFSAEVFADFPQNCGLSLLPDSFLTIQTSSQRQKPLTCRNSFVIIFLERNLKSKGPDGYSVSRNLPGWRNNQKPTAQVVELFLHPEQNNDGSGSRLIPIKENIVLFFYTLFDHVGLVFGVA